MKAEKKLAVVPMRAAIAGWILKNKRVKSNSLNKSSRKHAQFALQKLTF